MRESALRNILMKINVEVDITPDELRRFMGLPDVHEMQQSMVNQFTQRLQNSAEQSDEFVQNMFKSAMGPWQAFATIMGNAAKPGKSEASD